jgi:CubicO group peptidase (beta-lactamase class C family)
MERHVWWPYAVDGSLAVWRGPKGLRGSVTFDSMWILEPTRCDVAPDDGAKLRFTVRIGGRSITEATGDVTDGVFRGEAAWKDEMPFETCGLIAERVASPRRFEPDTPSSPFPVESDPAKLGVDPTALDRLIWYAARRDTDALVVVKDGMLVCDRTFLRPRGACSLSSITNAVSSLTIPLLVEDGKLPRDFDTPMTVWRPEWKGDARKSKITLRHVLTHTTGLDGSAASYEPGAKYEYSDRAMALLTGVVEKAAVKHVDEYVAERVFRPLGIDRWRWTRNGAGHASTSDGLELSAVDLARIGAMVADRGRFAGKQIVPEWWFDEIAKPSAVNEEVGLVWRLLRPLEEETIVQTQERIDRLRDAGFADADKLAPLVGKTFPGRRTWRRAVFGVLGDARSKRIYDFLPYPAVAAEIHGPVTCVCLSGAMGQYLVVVPEARLVVVRQRRGFAADELDKDAQSRAGFDDLERLAMDLVPR